MVTFQTFFVSFVSLHETFLVKKATSIVMEFETQKFAKWKVDITLSNRASSFEV